MNNKKNIIDFDLCIIGAGMNGQIIANHLKKKKIKIALIDSGDFKFDYAIQKSGSHTSTGISYPTEDTIKDHKTKSVKQFGGSANQWSNQTMFFTKNEIEDRPWLASDLKWQISYNELGTYYKKILKLLFSNSIGTKPENLPNVTDYKESYFDNTFLNNNIFDFPNSFHPKKIQKFNYKSKFSKKLINAHNIKIFTKYTATNFTFDENKKSILNVEIKSLKNTHHIKSKIFILCAGGIENPRILLNNIKNNTLLKNELIGKYFMEHPITKIGTIHLKKEVPLSTFFTIFKNNYNYRKGIRFTEVQQKQNKILNSHIFINPVFEENNYAKIRKIIKTLLKIKRPTNIILKNLSINNLLENIYFAPTKNTNFFINNFIRLYFNKISHNFTFTKLEVMYHGEQSPNISSKVYLNDSKDINNLNNMNIEWKLNHHDYNSIDHFKNYFINNPSDLFLFSDDSSAEIKSQNHKTGTTRMGDNKLDGVVDKNCKIFDINNLYVSGSSVFRTSGSANPGITEMAISLRLAEHLDNLL